jgi:hypothetical protein
VLTPGRKYRRSQRNATPSRPHRPHHTSQRTIFGNNTVLGTAANHSLGKTTPGGNKVAEAIDLHFTIGHGKASSTPAPAGKMKTMLRQS